MSPPRHPRMPASQVLAFTVTNLAQGVMLTMPFTVAVYMVRAFLHAPPHQPPHQPPPATAALDEAQVGRLTGLLAAAYSFAQFSTSYLWGLFSSRYGRKPVMVVGSAASAATLLWFGASGSLAGALLSRCVAGLANGIIVAWKCAIGESAGSTQEQGRVLSLMSLAWGIGCIIGPSIGGLTSSPCRHGAWGAWLPGCGADGLLRHRPYFLPCAISAAVNAAATALNVCLLRETLPRLVQAAAARQASTASHASAPSPCAAAICSTSTSNNQHQVYHHQAAATWRRMCTVAAAAARRLRPGAGGRYQQVGGLGAADSASDCELRRAECGLAGPDSSTKLSGQQQHMLRHEDSAGAIQLGRLADKLGLADQQAGCGDGDGDTAGPPQLRGRAPPCVLRPNDSVSEHTLQRAKSLAAAAGGSAGISSSSINSSSELGTARDQDVKQQPQQSDHPSSNSSSQQLSSSCDQQSEQQQGISSAAHSTSAFLHCTQQGSCNQATASSGSILNGSSSSSSSSSSSIAGIVDGDDEQEDDDQLASQPLVKQPPTPGGPAVQVQVPWYRQRQVVLMLMAYGCVCLVFCAIDELTPIFAAAPLLQGGLSLSEVALAGPLSFGGLCLIAVSLLAFAPAQRAWGTLRIARLGLVLAVVVALAIPCTRFAARTPSPNASASNSNSSNSGMGAVAWLVLYGAMLLKAVAGCFGFTATMILVNTSTPMEQLGQVNGVGQSLASLARGLGPACGGLLWSLTVRLHSSVAGAQLLPFACVAAVAAVALLLFAFVAPCDGEEVPSKATGTSCCQE